MAMSLSFRETGSDEANDNVVDICSYCATQDKLQPATHFCFDCGVYGRYICGICERNHKMFLGGHDAIYIGSQTDIQRNQRSNQNEVLELKTKYHEQETHLKQQNEELERRQTRIQKLENELKDISTKIQMYMTDQNEVFKLKKEIHEQEIRLQEQKEVLETRTKDIQKLKNEVKDIKSFNSVWTINPGCVVKDIKPLVIAIEIGHMFTKVGFSFQHEYQRDPLKVSCFKWSPGFNICVPTVVLFDENKQFHSFGHEADNTYTELVCDDKHHKWYFFKRLTMELNEDKTELTDVSGKKMNTVVVFGAVIKYLKEFLLHGVKERFETVLVGDIHWVLPVPARWTMFARQIIQQAAYTAGIDGEQLTIVSEAEVCSLYCEVAPMTVDSNGSRQAITHPGIKYIVIYLEEDTAEIIAYERQADGGIMELYKASCRSCCGTNVDEEFYLLLKRIFGDSVFQKFKNENLEDYLELQRYFVITKRTVTPNSNGRITIKVPVAILETYKDEMRKTIEYAIERSPYSGKITWIGGKMRYDAQIIKDLFKPCTDKIEAHIQDLLKQPDVQGTNIFLMVGGFSESEMVQDAIMKSIPSGKVVIPDMAGLAVLKGAVIYGHHYLRH